jgi:hypothetical protein
MFEDTSLDVFAELPLNVTIGSPRSFWTHLTGQPSRVEPFSANPFRCWVGLYDEGVAQQLGIRESAPRVPGLDLSPNGSAVRVLTLS